MVCGHRPASRPMALCGTTAHRFIVSFDRYGMWLLFTVSGLSTHLVQSEKSGSAFASPAAYFSFLYGRLRRPLALIYLSQWVVLAVPYIRTSVEVSYQNAAQVLLSIFLPTSLVVLGISQS